jgi:TonB family protein
MLATGKPQMARPAGSRLVLAFGLLLGLGAFRAPLAAQSLLLVEHGGSGKFAPVRQAVNEVPYVQQDPKDANSKLVPETSTNFVLAQASEFFPLFIEVKNFTAFVHAEDMQSNDAVMHGLAGAAGSTAAGNTRAMNEKLHFAADLQAPAALDGVFYTLTVTTKDAGSLLLVEGVGHLDAGVIKHLSVDKPLHTDMQDAQFTFHVFVGGLEALTAQVPLDQQAAGLDHMVARRIAALQDSQLKIFVAAPPVYPASLLKSKVKGQAVVSFRVGLKGEVIAPKVTSATDPAFGDAALEAIRQWRFLPRVKDHHAIETPVELPLVFDPPS